MSTARVTLLAATVLTGLSAGFFLSYETSVTPGLTRVDDATYVTAFLAVNEAVRNPAFAVTFFGPLVVIAVALALHWTAGIRPRVTIGAALLLYLSVIAVTGTGNVPLNDDLAAAEVLDAATAASARAAFEDDWNRLNLIRTGAAIASCSLLALSAVASTDPSRPMAVRPGRGSTASNDATATSPPRAIDQTGEVPVGRTQE